MHSCSNNAMQIRYMFIKSLLGAELLYESLYPYVFMYVRKSHFLENLIFYNLYVNYTDIRIRYKIF